MEGVIGMATDDMLHGGGDQHWSNIQHIATEYKLGKNQKGSGRFTGKDIRKEADGWMVRWAPFLRSRFGTKANGRTAYQDAFDTSYTGEVLPFGEMAIDKQDRGRAREAEAT